MNIQMKVYQNVHKHDKIAILLLYFFSLIIFEFCVFVGQTSQFSWSSFNKSILNRNFEVDNLVGIGSLIFVLKFFGSSTTVEKVMHLFSTISSEEKQFFLKGNEISLKEKIFFLKGNCFFLNGNCFFLKGKRFPLGNLLHKYFL